MTWQRGRDAFTEDTNIHILVLRRVDTRFTLVKPVVWMGSSLKDLKTFPKRVQAGVGHALYAAQRGATDPAAKPLRGFGGSSVMEITDRYDGDTFRAAYTATLGTTVYVLHVFQKKATKGIGTPKRHIDLIRARLKAAERLQKEEQATLTWRQRNTP